MNLLRSNFLRNAKDLSFYLRCASQSSSSMNTTPLMLLGWRYQSSGSINNEPIDPIIDISIFQKSLAKNADDISRSLRSEGFYSTSETYSILPKNVIEAMRHQSIKLRKDGRFEQSWSERIDSVSGKVTKFNKEGVFACEPDGRDYDSAPDLITYMSALLQTLPELLNLTDEDFGLSVSSFNAKLAVTSPGGSVYPLHIDNPQGLSVNDTRKLTCIIYLNPEYCGSDGGELRIYHKPTSCEEDKSKNYSDFSPNGGRIVLFWSDVIPHEVLSTSPNAETDDESKDRYALTLWIPTSNYHTIHDARSKFASLGNKLF